MSKHIQARIPDELFDELEALCDSLEASRSALITRGIRAIVAIGQTEHPADPQPQEQVDAR